MHLEGTVHWMRMEILERESKDAEYWLSIEIE